MISPPVYVYSKNGGNTTAHTVFGWREENGRFTPIVGNPDGPGVGPWELYYGEDPWYTSC
jgi:hypothetical protein